MNWEIPCEICGEMIPSGSDELYILSEGPEGNITAACHRYEWFKETGEFDWEKIYAKAEYSSDRQRENFK